MCCVMCIYIRGCIIIISSQLLYHQHLVFCHGGNLPVPAGQHHHHQTRLREPTAMWPWRNQGKRETRKQVFTQIFTIKHQQRHRNHHHQRGRQRHLYHHPHHHQYLKLSTNKHKVLILWIWKIRSCYNGHRGLCVDILIMCWEKNCPVLKCTTQHNTTLHCIIFYIALNCIVFYCNALHCSALCNALHFALLYCIQHITITAHHWITIKLYFNVLKCNTHYCRALHQNQIEIQTYVLKGESHLSGQIHCIALMIYRPAHCSTGNISSYK